MPSRSHHASQENSSTSAEVSTRDAFLALSHATKFFSQHYQSNVSHRNFLEIISFSSREEYIEYYEEKAIKCDN
jgi:hypothetical protein